MRETDEIKVWDLFVRIFHWVLVVGFFTAILTEDEMLGLHVWSGYLVFSIVILRAAWGLVGSSYARFSSFVYGPRETLQYLKKVFTFSAPRHIGHNPAGGWMIVALLVCLLITTGSGMWLWSVGEETSLGEMAEEVHEVFSNLAVLLVVIHVAGVLVESRLSGENLLKAMFTGRKPMLNETR